MKEGLVFVCAAILVGCAAPSRPEPVSALERLGWYADLAGSCWKGAADRQCYQTQFDRYLRGTIAMDGGFEGDSVVGWSDPMNSVVMYFWSNRAPGNAFRLSYEDDRLIFSATADAKARTVWTRVGADEIRVEQETFTNGDWVGSPAVAYRRDGEAPAFFEAAHSHARSARGEKFRWFGVLGGRCWAGVYPRGEGGDRQCYAFQYPDVMRASAAITAGDRSHRGDAAYFPTENGLSLYYWSDAGHFGEGRAAWEGDRLVMTTDADKASRTVWRREPEGFVIAAERQEGDEWRQTLEVDYAPESR